MKEKRNLIFFLSGLWPNIFITRVYMQRDLIWMLTLFGVHRSTLMFLNSSYFYENYYYYYFSKTVSAIRMRKRNETKQKNEKFTQSLLWVTGERMLSQFTTQTSLKLSVSCVCVSLRLYASQLEEKKQKQNIEMEPSIRAAQRSPYTYNMPYGTFINDCLFRRMYISIFYNSSVGHIYSF